MNLKPKLVHILLTSMGCLFLCVVLQGLALLSLNSSMAQGIDSDQGHILIVDAKLAPLESSWQLGVEADIHLSREIRQGLDSGVPLQFIVQVEVLHPRSYWFDQRILKAQLRYRLIHYELTKHYRLQALDSNQSRNFRSLYAATDALSVLKNIRIPFADTQDQQSRVQEPVATVSSSVATINKPREQWQDKRLQGRIRFYLDTGELPLPLQPLMSSNWRLASEEFTWPLN